MTETIMLALWFGTVMFFVCREIKTKSNRESNEWWISDLRDCLHSIECEFRRRCQEITEESFLQYNDRLYRLSYSYTVREFQIKELYKFVRTYDDSIDKLKKQYLNDLFAKVVERKGKYFSTSFPDYVIREYERNISNIADTYRHFGNCLDKNIWDIECAYKRDKSPKAAREEWEAEMPKEVEDFINQYKET